MDQPLLIFRRLAPGEGQILRVFNDRVTIKALAGDTGGAYALFEVLSAPQQGLPRHVQRYDDTSYFVLEGAYVFQIGEQTVALGPGGYVHVPREMPHGYQNVDNVTSRLLMLVSPAGIFEQFLFEIGASITTGEVLPELSDSIDVERISRAAEKYGIEFLPTLTRHTD